MASPCIFCRIVSGGIPASILCEDPHVLAFLDIGPVNPGHVLVIPKRHLETILELSPDELRACIETVQRVGRAAMAATGCPGLNVLQNNHRCAGQEIAHCHFHVIPRSPDDGMRFGWRRGEYGPGEIEAMRTRIADRLT